MKTLEGLFYSKDHEWIKVEGEKTYVGITDYAQKALGDIVYIELPEEDDEFEAGDSMCTIESVKAASELFTPLTGKVIEINEDLEDNPASVNSEPYESWIVCLELSDTSELDEMMSAKEYENFCLKEE